MGEVEKLVADSDGNLVMTLSPQTLNQMGWTEDTVLEWTIEEDGNVFVKEKK